jgi:tetratricopeptide (TPR) repeat protein
MRTAVYALSVVVPMLLTSAAEASPFIPPVHPAPTAAPAAAAACQADRGRGMASFNRGLVFYAQGEMENAVAAYAAAIRLDPRMSAAYDARGHALLAKGDMEGAMADFDAASRLRIADKLEWLAGRSPQSPVTPGDEGALALVAF